MSADALTADTDGPRIRGWNPQSGHISVPLISHIDGDLWMGGCIHGVTLPADFRWVLSLYDGEEYRRHPNTRCLTVPRFYDSADMRDDDLLYRLADRVLEMLSIGKTLVHCQAGLNRSGLITALALVKLGRTPSEAVELLRERRHPAVLCNQTFERWVLNLPGRRDIPAAPSPPTGASETSARKGTNAPEASPSPSAVAASAGGGERSAGSFDGGVSGSGPSGRGTPSSGGVA